MAKRIMRTIGRPYWMVLVSPTVIDVPVFRIDNGTSDDGRAYKIGNYFNTREDAEEVLNKVSELFRTAAPKDGTEKAPAPELAIDSPTMSEIMNVAYAAYPHNMVYRAEHPDDEDGEIDINKGLRDAFVGGANFVIDYIKSKYAKFATDHIESKCED